MALTHLLLSLISASAILAAPVNDENTLSSFMDKDFTSEMSSLIDGFDKFTAEDIAYLKGIIIDRESFANEHEILDKMRREAPETYTKFIQFLKPFYNKMKKLNEEAKKFFLDISQELAPTMSRSQEPTMEEMVTMGFKVSARYSALSAEAKKSIAEQFPVIAKGFNLINDLEKSMTKMFEI
ncbi:hypothetical protein PMAYCL1PPCAC_09194 [Pristionchus mayeri]|uniref:Fatty-acid and retinol-binding protein 1 n=1 Tax=Pristionchus mayeri TaxID=1317129 RepID=A0AAN4ZGF1_9BILA|nr:hypothetical protein PMAYCL1PPCAC_09194 [Pristionchus mayeri]